MSKRCDVARGSGDLESQHLASALTKNIVPTFDLAWITWVLDEHSGEFNIGGTGT